MQKDEMQTHLSVDQIRICAIRHPSKKKTKTSYLTLFLPTPKSVRMFQNRLKNSAIKWKLKRWTCHFLYTTKNRHFTAGCNRFARILHSRISNFPMSNNRSLKPHVYICLPFKRNTFTNRALFALFAKTLLSNKDGI